MDAVEWLVLPMVQELYLYGLIDLRAYSSLIELATYMIACMYMCLLLHSGV